MIDNRLNLHECRLRPPPFCSAGQVLIHLHDHVVVSDEMSDKQKSIILESVAVADKCLADGADEYLQLMSVGSAAMQTLCRAA